MRRISICRFMVGRMCRRRISTGWREMVWFLIGRICLWRCAIRAVRRFIRGCIRRAMVRAGIILLRVQGRGVFRIFWGIWGIAWGCVARSMWVPIRVFLLNMCRVLRGDAHIPIPSLALRVFARLWRKIGMRLFVLWPGFLSRTRRGRWAIPSILIWMR